MSYNHGGHSHIYMAFMTTPFFATSGKYHGAVWTSNHVIMVSYICGLGLQCQLFM